MALSNSNNTSAPLATVEYTTIPSYCGRYQNDAVEVTCPRSDVTITARGHGTPSVKWALRELTHKCTCGATYHRKPSD